MGWPTENDIERHRIAEAERDIKRSEDAWMGQRIAELEAALSKAIAYCDDARHDSDQYRDERGELCRVLNGQ